MTRGENIDDYIDEHHECKLNKTEPVTIAGRTADVPVFLLPFSGQKLLTYNKSNGRIKIWVDDMEKKSGHKLDPTNDDDAKKI